MSCLWRIRLFSGLEASGPYGVLDKFPTQKTAFLFAYLALNNNRALSRQKLAELLWPEQDWDVTHDRLNQAISSLRRSLEPKGVIPGTVLQTGRHAVRLRCEAVEVDVDEFEGCLAAAERTDDPQEKLKQLRQAATLYGKGFL